MTRIPRMPRPARHRRTIRGAIVLVGVAACVAVAAIGSGDGTPSWQRTVAFTGGLCLTASLAGWIVARWPHRSPALAVAGGLAGVLVRIMPPLAALAWLRGSQTTDRGDAAEFLVLAFYLPLLATDIFLNMMEVERPGRTGGGNSVN